MRFFSSTELDNISETGSIFRTNNTGSLSHQCCLYPIVYMKFLENVGHIVLNGFLANVQTLSDFSVAASLGE